MDDVAPDEPIERSAGVNLQRLARGGIFSLAGSVVGGVASFLMAAVIARGTTPESAGVLFACISVFLIVFTTTKLGASTGLVYFMARLVALGQSERLRSVLRTATGPVVVFALAASVILVVFAPGIAARLIPSQPEAAVGPLRVMAVFLPFAVLADLSVFGGRGLRELRPLVLIDRLGRPVGQLGLVALAVLAGAVTATQLTLAWALPFLPAALVAGWWLRRLLQRHERLAGVQAPTHGLMRREFWTYTWPRWLQSISAVVLQRLDIVLLAALVGATQAAIYAVVTRFLVFGQLTATSIGAVVEPYVSRLVALDERAALSTVYQTSTAWLVLVTWPIYVGLLVFSGQLPLVFGESYAAGTSVIVILSLTMLVATACGLVDVLLSMAGKTLWTFANAMGALIINIALNLVLIPVWGIKGSAIAWSAAILFKNLAALVQIRVGLELLPFGRTAMLAAGIVLGTLAVIPGALTVAGADLVWRVLAFAVALVGYASIVWHRRATFGLDALVRRGASPPAGAV